MRNRAMDAGSTISHYRLVEKLDSGGMGVVYKAQDLHLPRFVALKFLPAELSRDPHARQRFESEARIISSLEHSAICVIHDVEETPDGRLFIVMPCYEGEGLNRRLERGPLPITEVLHIIGRVADALACAHAHGVIHRDIKPSNIMITADGEARVLDFGLAKLRGTTSITRFGETVGTCSYMSPEQASGHGVDARSDIFSLGVTLYQCLTGVVPFDGDRAHAVLYQVVNVDPAPVTTLRPDIPVALEQIVQKAIQKNVNDRYQSVAEMRDDLERVANGLRPRVRLPRRRHRALLAAGLVPVLALAAWGTRLMFPAVPDTLHVAVVPFENVGNDPLNQPFCDGLMETLTSQLSQVQSSRASMWVVPASAVREREVTTPAQAYRVLGANLVLTGAVQRMENHLRITLSLIDPTPADGPKQLNAAMIDNLMTRMQSLQDEAVERMARMLRMRLNPAEQAALAAGRTEVSAAFDFYVQGIGYLSRYESGDNLDRAIDAFSMAIDQDSLYARAHAGLGEAYWRKHRDTTDPQWIEPALAHTQRALEIDDDLAAAHVTMGMIQAGTNRETGAMASFERAIAIEPGDAKAYSGLAGVYASLKRTADAEATYRRAIEAKPDYWGGYHELGMFHYRQGQYEKAVREWGEVVKLTPENKFAYNNLGAAYWALEQRDRAREMFLKSVSVEPTFRAYSNLGALYYIEGDYVSSARMCEKAVAMNDQSYKSWANLGNAYYWMPGKREDAIKSYTRAVELAETQRVLTPNDPALLTSLAGYYAILERAGPARELIRESLSIAPNNSRVRYFAGHAYEQMGQRDLAIENLGRAIEAGYPKEDLEGDPFMHELRRDPRYAQMLKSASEK